MHVQLVALSSAFDGDGLQSLLQTPGVKLPRRGESQTSLIKSAHDLTSWQEEAAVAPCALGRYRPHSLGVYVVFDVNRFYPKTPLS